MMTEVASGGRNGLAVIRGLSGMIASTQAIFFEVVVHTPWEAPISGWAVGLLQSFAVGRSLLEDSWPGPLLSTLPRLRTTKKTSHTGVWNVKDGIRLAGNTFHNF